MKNNTTESLSQGEERLKEEFFNEFTNEYNANFCCGGDYCIDKHEHDFQDISNFWIKKLKSQREEILGEKINENTSDGYHTFKELYEFRKLYNASLFNEWANSNKYDVHKSKKHNEGDECFGGGWFIIMAELPTGQISNHYEMKDWDLFNIFEKERANKWDGHTAQDVAKRLNDFLSAH